ncbi:MAG: cytochrome c oxidase subunit I [Acidimicrobiia bacterium]|nr:cytochrome c oxidase subunit I [Acidimicrobiia bacterium]
MTTATPSNINTKSSIETKAETRIATLIKRPTKTRGLGSWFTSVDHKRIALLYIATALFFFLFGGVEALLIRMQLFSPNSSVLTAAQYNQMFTMHGTTMIFLVGMPLAAAFGNYLIPLQIGARDVAFPRLNALGYWILLFGGIFMYSSFFMGGAPNGGWFGYTPLTSSPYSSGILPGRGADFWAVGLIMLGIGSTTSAINFIVTTINMRAPGMKLMRMPIVTWMILVTSFMTAFALPVFTAALIMVFFDRNFDTNFFFAATGGDPLLYQHMFWIFGHPEVYILILPGMGIVSEILPVFARKPLFGHSVVVFSGIAIGFVGWGVWAHHMFATGLGPVTISAFGVATMMVGVPTGVKIFNWLGTLWGGSLRFNSPMLYSIGFIAMFTIGGLSGVMHAVVPADTQQTDTYFIIAHFHYVLFGGLVFAIFGGIHYWFPKMFGRMMNDKLGKYTFWLVLIGFNFTFGPMHLLGLAGQARRTWRYQEDLQLETWNKVATIGAFTIATATLMFVYNIIRSKFKGEVAGADPWDARTLEWSIPSPVPEYNFLEVPHVEAVDDFWHRKYTEDADGRLMLREGVDITKEPIRVTTQEAIEKYGVHLPSPSFWPLILGLALPIAGYGLVFHNWFLCGLGVFVFAFSLLGWSLEPDAEPHAHHKDEESHVGVK